MLIDRRQFLAASSFAALVALLPSRGRRTFAFAQEAAPLAELRGGVGIFTGREGGTIGWFAGKDGAVLIDSQFPKSAAVCLKAMQERAARPLDLLINTHHHPDHTGGNGVFKPFVGKIVAHSKVPELQRAQAKANDKEKEQVYADTLFPDEWKQELGAGGEVVRAHHFGPAHTGGDAIVYFEKANIAHMGDLVFNRWYPFIDRKGGASIRGWIQVLEKTLASFPKDTIYIFGHAKQGFEVTGGAKELELQRDFFVALLEHVEKGLAASKSREEIAALAALPGFPDHVGLTERLSLKACIETAIAELEPKK